MSNNFRRWLWVPAFAGTTPLLITLRTRFLLTATNGIGGKGNGASMKHCIGAAAVLLAAGPAVAADVATCSLSADKKTVTVTASNPYSEVMACSVNCHMAIPNGIATVVCVKPVPAGAKDFVMCTEPAGSLRQLSGSGGAAAESRERR